MQHDIGVRHTPLVTFTDAMKVSLKNLEGVYFALIFGDRDMPYHGHVSLRSILYIHEERESSISFFNIRNDTVSYN